MSELRLTHTPGPLCMCDACRKDPQHAQVITPPWQPPLFDEKSIHELQDALAAMTAERNAARAAMRAMAEHESDGLEYALVVVLKADLEKMTSERDAAVKRADEVDRRMLAIHDLASARLRNPPLDPMVEHDLGQIVISAQEILSDAVPR